MKVEYREEFAMLCFLPETLGELECIKFFAKQYRDMSRDVDAERD